MCSSKAYGYRRLDTLQSESGSLSRAADVEVSGDLVIRFDELCRANLARVFNYVRYRVLNTAVAEDVTADIFTSAFENLNSYRSERGTVSTWLFTIARRRVADYFRRSRRSVDSVPLEMALSESVHICFEKIGTQAVDAARIVQTMKHLGDHEREVIALRVGASLSSREIGDQLGLKPGNVDVILHRSLTKLRTLLIEGGDSRG